MANPNNNLSNLINELSSLRIDGLNVSKLLSPTRLVDYLQSSEKALKIGKAADTRLLSFNAKDVSSSIKFGAPSSTKTSTSSSASAWANLLKQTATGGIASVLSGGLGSIGGVGLIVSGILSLFGGGSSKSTPPPLIEFQLPPSQDQTIYVSSNGSSAYQGSAPQSPGRLPPNAAIQASGETANPSPSAPTLQYRSAEIAQAVKIALLNSNSLNDVIAEI